MECKWIIVYNTTIQWVALFFSMTIQWIEYSTIHVTLRETEMHYAPKKEECNIWQGGEGRIPSRNTERWKVQDLKLYFGKQKVVNCILDTA